MALPREIKPNVVEDRKKKYPLIHGALDNGKPLEVRDCTFLDKSYQRPPITYLAYYDESGEPHLAVPSYTNNLDELTGGTSFSGELPAGDLWKDGDRYYVVFDGGTPILFNKRTNVTSDPKEYEHIGIDGKPEDLRYMFLHIPTGRRYLTSGPVLEPGMVLELFDPQKPSLWSRFRNLFS